MDAVALLRRGAFVGLAFGALCYLGFSLYAETGSVLKDLQAFNWLLLIPILLLSLLNYGVRFVRWQFYLKTLELDVPAKKSASIFISGLAMTITPGKIGELLKSVLLKEQCGVPIARTASVVMAERVTDLLALVFWAALGVGFYYQEGVSTVIGTGLVLVAGVLLIQSRPLILWILRQLDRIGPLASVVAKVRELYVSAHQLLTLKPLSIGLCLGVLAWGMECTGLWVVYQGSGVETSVLMAGFIYAFSTIAGVVSPGGLGITDGLLVVLSMQLIPAMVKSLAVSAAFIIRLATLWFAVALGALFLMKSGAGDVSLAEKVVN